MLFGNHNGELVRRQPRAFCTLPGDMSRMRMFVSQSGGVALMQFVGVSYAVDCAKWFVWCALVS